MGHNWMPDCHRAGDRVPQECQVIARELHGGVPVIQGPDGPEADPSVSEDNGYAPGVGGGLSGEILGGIAGDKEARDDVEEDPSTPAQSKSKSRAKAKGKGVNWQKVVKTSRLKEDSVSLMALLSDVSTTKHQSDLCTFITNLCSSNSTTSMAGSPTSQSPSPITQTLQKLEHIRESTHVLSFYSMIQSMQLAILVDLYVHSMNLYSVLTFYFDRELKKLSGTGRTLAAVHRGSNTSMKLEAFRRHQAHGFRFIELVSGCE